VFYQDGIPEPLRLPKAYAQEDQKPVEPAAQAPAPVTPPPTTSTQPTAMGEREKALELREERLKEREKALAALESDLNVRMVEIEETRKKLAELVTKQEALVDEQKILKNARIDHLVTAYKGMRPERAGSLVNSLDDDVAVLILSAMPGRNAGQILAYVDPEKAARLTKAISERKDPMPEPSEDDSPPQDDQTPPPDDQAPPPAPPAGQQPPQ
jgi:flagellar motility protein MotE (MotC chaperone)